MRRSVALEILFAMSVRLSVSVIDLWQCISMQLFWRSCLIVLRKYVVSLRRAENVRSEVVIYYFSKSFGIEKGEGRGVEPPQILVWGLQLPLPPRLRRLCSNPFGHSVNVLFVTFL